MKSLSIPQVAVLAALASAPATALFCKTESQPNPISSQYPNDVTGTINGTVAILPIPYTLARQIVPQEYNILQHAYQSLLPDFPKDMYPAMLQTELDHDVGQGSLISVPDFTRAGLSFPFVDRLGDGYTSMAYGDTLFISILNPVALIGSGLYGNTVTGARFEPPCDAYECVKRDEGGSCESTHFAAYNALEPFAGPKISHNFSLSSGPSPYSLAFYKNVTNQPQFSNNKLFCDNYIRLYNSSITQTPYEPQVVRGSVSVTKPVLKEAKVWQDVWGLQMDNAFIERNYKSCKSLQGYTFTG